MNRTTLTMAAALVIATMAVAALAVGSSTPANLELPVHWGLNGEPDRFAGKWEALLTVPALTAAVSLLFYFIPAIEPRREGLARSQGLYLWGWVAILLMGSVIQLATASLALGWPIHAYNLIAGGLGASLILIGNQLGKSRSMYLIGLRTPWTLASEDVWVRTHRLAGKLVVAGGALIVVAAALLPSGPLAAIILAVVGVAAGIPIVYSLLLWRRERAAQPSE
ncbi:MAG TPA: SdpI family protein [Allosphingosinicella sp.]|jgi:uncharacterized membrane protein